MIRRFFTNSCVLNSTVHLRNNNNAGNVVSRMGFVSFSGSSTNFKDAKVKNSDFDLSDTDLLLDVKVSVKNDQPTKTAIIKKFKHIFDCDEEKARDILESNKALLKFNMSQITNQIEYLFERKVSIKSILENSWLLCLSPKYLKIKLDILENMEPKNVNDFVPLMKCAPMRLSAIQLIMRKERKHIPEKNRIYYFSKRLGDVESSEVSKYFSTHLFMFDISFDMLVENLNILLQYNVAPINILRDLWAFKYLPKSVRTRLERAKQAQKEKIMPWMVRCPEPVLAKSLQLSLDERNLLGDMQDVVEYLSERLGYDVETTRYIAMKHEAVLKVRVTKVRLPSNSSNFLKFSLNFLLFQIRSKKSWTTC